MSIIDKHPRQQDQTLSINVHAHYHRFPIDETRAVSVLLLGN